MTVLVPYRPGDPHRDAAWLWASERFGQLGRTILTGGCADGPFNRAAAILDAAKWNTGDAVVVIADADIACDGIPEAIEAVEAGAPWAVPHTLIHRLSPESTEQVLAGADWRGLSLSTDNRQDSRPYRGHETGTLVVIRRDVLAEVPPDPRFVGWGSEDDAWAAALRTLVGKPWRGTADLVHLWHPPQPRKTRIVGTDENAALLHRYRRANHRPDAMRSLIAEGQTTHASH